MKTLSLVLVMSPLMVGLAASCSTTNRPPASSPAGEQDPATDPAADPAADPTADPTADPPPVNAYDPAPTPTPTRRATTHRLSTKAKAILKVHNAARKAVGVPPLVWSAKIARHAQAWANRLARLQTLQHRPHSGIWKRIYGENLAMAGGSSAIADYGQKGSLQWLGEKRRYRHGSHSLAGVGHYTQMVWRKTLRIGCATAHYQKGPWKNVILVCNYDPAGNMMGESPY